MDFSLTETQAILQDSARRLVREHYDFDGRQKHLADGQRDDSSFWRLMAEIGLLGIGIEEEYGGSGGDFYDLAVVLEAFGGGLVVEPYIPTLVLGAGLVIAAGSRDQKSSLLPGVVAGETRLAMAHGEFGARYDLRQVATTAAKEGANYVINGSKAIVWGGDSASTLIVSARTTGGTGDKSGISLFLLKSDYPGLKKRTYSLVDDSQAADIDLKNISVPASALLGPEGGGLPLIEQAVDRATAALCCDAVGAMNALNEMTLDYLKTREQFGRSIGKFQVLQHRMVDMTIAEEQARSMAVVVANAADETDRAARMRGVSAAKAEIGKCAKTVGQNSTQLHGGIGLTVEYSASHYFRRLTAFENYFGDTDHHLERFAGI